MSQQMCFGAMCDTVANSDYTDYKNTDYMEIICDIEHTGYAHLQHSCHSKVFWPQIITRGYSLFVL